MQYLCYPFSSVPVKKNCIQNTLQCPPVNHLHRRKMFFQVSQLHSDTAVICVNKKLFTVILILCLYINIHSNS